MKLTWKTGRLILLWTISTLVALPTLFFGFIYLGLYTGFLDLDDGDSRRMREQSSRTKIKRSNTSDRDLLTRPSHPFSSQSDTGLFARPKAGVDPDGVFLHDMQNSQPEIERSNPYDRDLLTRPNRPFSSEPDAGLFARPKAEAARSSS